MVKFFVLNGSSSSEVAQTYCMHWSRGAWRACGLPWRISGCRHRAELVTDVLQDTPEARGRLLIDLINEPDGYSLTWEARIPVVLLVRMSWGIEGFMHAHTVACNSRTAIQSSRTGALLQGLDGYPSMTLLYLNAMDRLWQICPDCLFLIEGAQQQHLPTPCTLRHATSFSS